MPNSEGRVKMKGYGNDKHTSSLHHCNNYSSVMLKVSGKGVSLRVTNTLAYYNAELPP